MIVTIAAGGISNLSLNPLDGMQTMTAYIMNVTTCDVERGTIKYESIFAVGLMLFVFTLSLNMLAQVVIAKFREIYD